MNEPKRRGRPPKTANLVQWTPEQAAEAIEQGVKVMCSTDENANAVAQAYAQRIWDGQSESVTRAERLHRVKMALEAQGLSMEGVTL